MPRPLVTNAGLAYRDGPTHVLIAFCAVSAVAAASMTLYAEEVVPSVDALWLGVAIAVGHVTVYLARIEPDSHSFSGDEIPMMAALVALPDQLGWALVISAAAIPVVRRRFAMLGRMRSASLLKITFNVSGIVVGGFAALNVSRAAQSADLPIVAAAALGGLVYSVVTWLLLVAVMRAATVGGSTKRVLMSTAREALPTSTAVTVGGIVLGLAVRGSVAPGPTILLVTAGLYLAARSRMTAWRAAEAGDRILRVVPDVLDGSEDVDVAIRETARRLLSCREARISPEPAKEDELGVPLDQDGRRIHLVVGDRIGEHRSFDVEDLVLLENLATLAASARSHRWTLDQLRRSEETRTAIVGALGHDLRSPLATVATTVGTLRRFGDRLDDRTTADMLDGADRQTQRALTILDDLLALERLTTDPLTTATADVRAAALATAAAHPGSVTVEPGPDAIVRLDERLIERILDNLVSNARKHAPGTPIRISWAAVGRDVALTVEDGGVGIPTELRDRLTQPFQQGDPRSEGVGLGLHLARRFTELAGGHLEIDDAATGGASIRVVLPAFDATGDGAGSVSSGSSPSSS